MRILNKFNKSLAKGNKKYDFVFDDLQKRWELMLFTNGKYLLNLLKN